MKKFLLYFSLLVVSGVVFSACIGPFAKQAPVEESMDEDQAMLNEAEGMIENDQAMEEAMMEEEVDFDIEMGMFYFEPSVLEVEPGQTVKVRISSVKGLHDFVIDELEVASTQLSDGESEVFEFTVPEDASGNEYEFYCSVMDHRERGMVGTLVVR